MRISPKIIWIKGTSPEYTNPLLAILDAGVAELVTIEVQPTDSPSTTLKRVEEECQVEQRACSIVLDAFLDPQNEGVEDERWPTSTRELKKKVSGSSSERLRSLQLMRGLTSGSLAEVQLLINTNGIELSEEVEFVLEDAFLSGVATLIYGGRSSRPYLQRLASSILH